MLKFKTKTIIEEALLEDLSNGDITTENIIEPHSISTAEIIVKQNCVIAGLEVAFKVFELLDSKIEFKAVKKDGDEVKDGDIIAVIKGKTRSILSGERTALNFLQRMSGIATKTASFVDKVRDYNVKIADTRKTTPGFRALEKYAVKIGGGYNHRFDLSDAILIKDNHLKAAGGVKKSIEVIKERISHITKVEVEVKTLEEFKEALDANADIIMLDNMSFENMKKAVKYNKNFSNKATLEASGNINIENVEEVAKTGVDVISIGGLTHSVKAVDISLNII